MTQNKLTSAAIIAQELNVSVSQVEATIRLLDEGATVPFIARYRKEATGSLNDVQLRALAERLVYLRELDERRTVILNSIREQQRLTPTLEHAILHAETKARLEDLYLPFRPKRRTKALIAIEAGLEPLALDLWQNPSKNPEEEASKYIAPEKDIENTATALEGAQHILIERFAEEATLVSELRDYLWNNALVHSTASSKKQEQAKKFSDYFNYCEAIKKIPSHRALALFRGRREGALHVKLTLPPEETHYGINKIAAYFNIPTSPEPAQPWLMDTVRMTWKVKLNTKLELELLTRLRELADEEAIKVFSRNLRDLLLAAPAGPKITLGLDPGIRTGVKVVVVDTMGKVLDYTVIFPFSPQNEWHQSITELTKLVVKYKVALISIGNGTGSRETERLVADMIKMYPDINLTKIVVNEAGASIYSASELASKELPDLDVSLRGAVSIARRLQDPLAELVKIEAKSTGVGQYQHDVNQARLERSLDGVVEDCVNAVGVDVNTASTELLTHISGLNNTLAKNIVQYREEQGAFTHRHQLKNVPRMGEKAFQQAAGFLRIMHGDNPLDASCVHPESYPLVEKISTQKHVNIPELIGNTALLATLEAQHYVDDHYGLVTIQDILKELEKPGRDPRPAFKTARFKEGVETISQLQKGMVLEGIVSNVTNFGAFVDIGVHQDGLVHISEMTHRFISDPHTIAKAGDIVTVKVVEIDEERKRIGLSMKLENAAPSKKPIRSSKPNKPSIKMNTTHAKKKLTPVKAQPVKKTIFNTAMADAFKKLKQDH